VKVGRARMHGRVKEVVYVHGRRVGCGQRVVRAPAAPTACNEGSASRYVSQS
jgi:hypothetical protein